jgi:hypothetical protein
MNSSTTFDIILILVIILNVIWYSAKILIRNNGLKANWFWGHFRDFHSLYTLWKGDFPADVQTKAKLHLFSLIISFILFITFFIGMALGFIK